MAHRQTPFPKVVVITGGTMGIGRATAIAFAQDGWSVAILARGETRLRSTEAELRTLGAQVLGISCDVTDADAVHAAASRIEAELGPIEAWVNNAMATVLSPAVSVTPADYRRVTEVTYLGQVFGTLAALKLMKTRDRGVIVQVSSGLAIRAAPLQSAYCGAKSAVGGFTDSLRAELIHDKSHVRLVTIYLPAVNTPQFRRARNYTGAGQNAPDPVFDPRACATAIVAAVASPQREIWVGRSTMQMAAIQAIAPGFGDKQAAKMWDAQLDHSISPASPGNLYDVDEDDPGVDGPFSARTKRPGREFVTSRSRNALAAALGVASLFGAAAALAPLAVAVGIGSLKKR
ncbi:SDR family oxidoreductase [Lichenicola cladoniae]|uniref:SDR family oxidoreductase n=1 Tax=Lichenicola cladoniae TaxID=1484109 RepID=A0A6M8HLZ8_9PROT|nr:SDR family oxidoreductase [Lichenicola cladoniae]NPD69937.1 SDR family oxidoreductase [Acetobacteraceae bacterium]QKE89357.1 SDR family oxidoreductase [Lichenicola cladoniae]